MIKQMIIPVAAFAVTATAASAFSTDMLEKIDVNLSDSQVSALEEAHEMRDAGVEREEVKTFLETNGVDKETMKEIKKAVREVRKETREAVRVTLENDDYEAFREVAADTRLAEAIESEADFEILQEAYELKESGDREGAKELMAELGIEKPDRQDQKSGHRGGFDGTDSAE